MKIESSYISLRNVRFYAFHGVMPQERRVGADFLVTLRVGFPLEKAMLSDEIGDTLNYAALYTVVQTEMKKPSNLLEHVVGRIADAIVKRFPQVTSIDLELTKQNPPMGADCDGAVVEIHLINDKTE
ncbi:MAG: dihydroneopterin aldolase [Prevotella sp.]|nr:dihydroneopterin aldolase [Prevotella sp.]